MADVIFIKVEINILEQRTFKNLPFDARGLLWHETFFKFFSGFCFFFLCNTLCFSLGSFFFLDGWFFFYDCFLRTTHHDKSNAEDKNGEDKAFFSHSNLP